MRVKPDQIINGFDSAYYLLTQPDVATAGLDPLAHFQAFGWKEGRMPNGLFDPKYYLDNNADVRSAGINPLDHYLRFGFSEGRNPSASFNTSTYLSSNSDVAAAKVNPLLHYLNFGAFEGRPGGAILTTGTAGRDYLIGTAGGETLSAGAGNDFIIAGKGNDTVDGGAGTDTARFAGKFVDYTISFDGAAVIVDGPEGRDVFTNVERFAFQDVTFDRTLSTSLVDEFYYFATNKDVFASGVDAATHYATFGWKEGRDPNAFFDTSFYLDHNPDVKQAGINPLTHFLQFGFREQRDPSANFDTSAYLEANPDVANAGINPLQHYLQYGQSEGRSPTGNQAPTATNLTQSASYTEDAGPVALGNIVVSDVDEGDTITATLKLSNPAAGALTTTGGGTFNASTGTWTVTGSVDAVNAALAAVEFTPAANFDKTFTITTTIKDSAGTGPASGTITLTGTGVPDAPTATQLTQSLTYTEDLTRQLNDIVVTDVDTGDVITATLKLSDPSAGLLTTSGGASYNSSTGTWTITGTVSAVNAALAAVAFTPAANVNDDVTITTTIKDAAGAGPANGTITLTGTPVNDAPTATGLSTTVTMAEDGLPTALFASAPTVGDIDSATVIATLTIDPAHGALIGAMETEVAGVYTITGSPAVVATALAAVQYDSAPNFHGQATIAVVISDGANGPQGANPTGTVTFNVQPINDAPSGADKTVTFNEDNNYVFKEADFGFTDAVDGTAASTLAAITIVTVPASGQLLLVHGDAPPEVVTNGQTISAADIPSLVYRPMENANNTSPAPTFTFAVQDNGGTSNGGVDTEGGTHTITLNILPVNDAPVVKYVQPLPVPEGTVDTSDFGTVGTVSATDVEGTSNFTFTLFNTDGSPYTGPFQIDASGNITVRTTDPLAINYEDVEGTHVHELIVRVAETANQSVYTDQNVKIAIGDQPEDEANGLDGYITGATVFIDEVIANGIWDPGEYRTTTDAFGNFKIIGTHNGTLYLSGGIDSSTNIAFEGVLRAPSGSKAVTPLTTLIVALMEGNPPTVPGMSEAEATAKVKQALSLSDSIDLKNFDPIAMTLTGASQAERIEAAKVFAAGVQVYSTIVQASALLEGAGQTGAAAGSRAASRRSQQLRPVKPIGSRVGDHSSQFLVAEPEHRRRRGWRHRRWQRCC